MKAWRKNYSHLVLEKDEAVTHKFTWICVVLVFQSSSLSSVTAELYFISACISMFFMIVTCSLVSTNFSALSSELQTL